MEKTIYIYHHLGLGDHIMLNGFVRHFCELYDKVWLFAKPTNYKNVKQMYNDLSNLSVIALDDGGVRDHMRIFSKNNYLVVGHTSDFFKRIDDPTNGKYFDQLFYEDHNIPFEYKWNKFYLERNIEKEKEVYYNILGLNDDSKYIFVHESIDRLINKQIPPNIKIIRPDNKEIKLFDYLYTIEKSQQIHVMNSSFMNLIDCIQLRDYELYYHEYSRPNINTVLKLPWIIIK